MNAHRHPCTSEFYLCTYYTRQDRIYPPWYIVCWHTVLRCIMHEYLQVWITCVVVNQSSDPNVFITLKICSDILTFWNFVRNFTRNCIQNFVRVINATNTIFTFSSRTEYVKSSSNVITREKVSPFDECPYFVCFKLRTSEKKSVSRVKKRISERVLRKAMYIIRSETLRRRLASAKSFAKSLAESLTKSLAETPRLSEINFW